MAEVPDDDLHEVIGLSWRRRLSLLLYVQCHRDKHWRCWRLIIGPAPVVRYCAFDWTRSSFFPGKPDYWRVRLFRWTVIERHREYSGLPDPANWKE